MKYLAVVLFQIYLLKYIKISDINKRNRNLVIILNLIFISLIISLIVNFNITGAIKTISLIDMFIITFFMYSRISNRWWIDENIILEIISNTLFVALMIGFVFFFNDTMINLGRSSGISVRHVFGTGAPSVVGFLCFIEFSISFFLFEDGKRNMRGGIVNLLKMGLSVWMMILADIRAALFTVIIFVMLYIFGKLPRNKIILAFRIVSILILIPVGILYLTDMSINTDALNILLSRRIDYFHNTINNVVNNNAVLLGMGSFRNSEVKELSRIQVDNSFLDIFYQYGLVNMVLFIILVILICVMLYKINKIKSHNLQKKKSYDIFVGSYFVSVLIYSMVEKNLFSISSALSLITFLIIFCYIDKNEHLIKPKIKRHSYIEKINVISIR